MNIKLLNTILFTFAFLSLCAKTIRVPEDKITIQAGLNIAKQGDTVLVNSGTYKENIIWPGTSDLSLIGKNGPKKTIIDGDKKGRTLLIQALNPLLYGLTITGGMLTGERSNGGGIYCSSDGLTIDSCIITANNIEDATPSGTWCYGAGIYLSGEYMIKNSTVSYNVNKSKRWAYGGGLYVYEASGEISNSRILNNTADGAWSNGGGIYLYGANVKLNNNRFENNRSANMPQSGGVAIYAYTSRGVNSLDIVNCLFRQNFHNVILSYNQNFKMTNSTIFNDYSSLQSISFPAVQFDNFIDSTVANIINCIIWGASKDKVVIENSSKNNLSVTYSAIQGGFTGTGNISEDPFFADKLCHLSENSPCLNAGNNDLAPQADIDGNLRPYPAGTKVDMGCFELPTFRVITSTTTESKNTRSPLGLNIFPNPSLSNQAINVEVMDTEQIESYSLMNYQGISLVKGYNINSRSFTLNVHDLAQGTYLIEVRKTNGTRNMGRFIVN